MSKYIKRVAMTQIDKIKIVFGKGRSLDKVKAEESCDLIMNCGLYDMNKNVPVAHLKTDGVVYAKESWGTWGYAWNEAGDFQMLQIPAPIKKNYFCGVALLTPWDGINKKLSYDSALGGARGRTAIAMKGGDLILYCSGDGTGDKETPEGLRAELYRMGADTAVMLDSGGSSQCDFGNGEKITSSRRVNNYFCIWLKKPSAGKEETTMTKKVCLDAGHGLESQGKCSPDKSYYEMEFTLDMALRIRNILSRHGVEVTLTRTGTHCLSSEADNAELQRRCDIANKIAGLDLFVSLHSNAAGNGSNWTSAEGWEIYTSAAGDTAKRNVAAKAILKRVKEAGIELHANGVLHEMWYVCAHTVAPAVLIEHGFHDNKNEVDLLKREDYRNKLAAAECKGILDYLGITWKEDTEKEAGGDEPDKWAKPSWEKAEKKGIMEGTRPRDAVTRQELAVILDRAGMLS